MNEEFVCGECGTLNHFNLEKRPTVPKYCSGCKTKLVEPRKSRSLLKRLFARVSWRDIFAKRPNTHKASVRRDGSTGYSDIRSIRLAEDDKEMSA